MSTGKKVNAKVDAIENVDDQKALEEIVEPPKPPKKNLEQIPKPGKMM